MKLIYFQKEEEEARDLIKAYQVKLRPQIRAHKKAGVCCFHLHCRSVEITERRRKTASKHNENIITFSNFRPPFFPGLLLSLLLFQRHQMNGNEIFGKEFDFFLFFLHFQNCKIESERASERAGSLMAILYHIMMTGPGEKNGREEKEKKSKCCPQKGRRENFVRSKPGQAASRAGQPSFCSYSSVKRIKGAGDILRARNKFHCPPPSLLSLPSSLFGLQTIR